MALSLREAIAPYQGYTDVVGIPLRRRRMDTSDLELLAEIAQLRETLAAKDAHISTLQTSVWAWRSQAMNEARLRGADADQAYAREHDLIRVIHRQMQAGEAPIRRRWWLRRG